MTAVAVLELGGLLYLAGSGVRPNLVVATWLRRAGLLVLLAGAPWAAGAQLAGLTEQVPAFLAAPLTLAGLPLHRERFPATLVRETVRGVACGILSLLTAAAAASVVATARTALAPVVAPETIAVLAPIAAAMAAAVSVSLVFLFGLARCRAAEGSPGVVFAAVLGPFAALVVSPGGTPVWASAVTIGAFPLAARLLARSRPLPRSSRAVISTAIVAGLAAVLVLSALLAATPREGR